MLFLVKFQAEACNFTKSNTPLWGFFTIFKLYEWYQIAQSTIYAKLRQIFKKRIYKKKQHWHRIFLKLVDENAVKLI